MGWSRVETYAAWLSNCSEHREENPDTAEPQTTCWRQLWQGTEMAVWVVLLRGVNVGGANRLAMADLRDVVTSLGHSEVATYIQSGNVVLSTDRKDRAAMAEEICAGIKATSGLSVLAVLRTPKEMRASVAANPFEEVPAPARELITYLSAAPAADDIATLEPDRFLPDQFVLIGSELYGMYANGSGRSKMTLDYFEKRLHVHGTSRNLNTVAKLIELAGG